MPEVSTHPTAQALAQFGHGKLPEAQAAAVAAHLETCADCRQVVAGLPPDSFLGKVRAAVPGDLSLPSGPSPARLTAAVPPELANHPKFRIVRELGKGGMGVIYLAQHRVLDKPVALKVISPAVLDNPDALARFQAEARAAGKLDHPNIARAFDADQAGDLHFLVMEYVEGLSLAQLLEKKGPLSVSGACHCACQAALGLQHAFEQGMAHRDIKPQNLMLTPRGQVKVLDFGLARLRGARAPGKGLTQADSFMGTPEYVAPEQATDARSADTRADIYSLGCTLYALLAGQPPFFEDTMVKLVLAHIEKEPPPLHEARSDVPLGLSAVVAKMLAKDPAQRYQRPVEVAQALAPFAKGGAKVRGTGAAPAAGKSAGTGTVVGGDTSRVVGLAEKAPQSAANKPATGAEPPPRDPEWTRHPPAPSPVKKPQKQRKAAAPAPGRKRLAVLVGAGIGAVLLLLAVLWAAGVLRLKTKDGVIVLEDLPPDAEVTVDGEKVTLQTLDGHSFAIGIAPGKKQRLQVKKDGFTTFGVEVELDAGGRRTVTVRLEPLPAADPDAERPAAPAGKPDRPGAEYDALATARWTPLLPSKEEFERLRSQKSYIREEPRFDRGILETRNGGRLIFPSVDAANVIVRARVRKLSPKGEGGLRNVGLSVRHASGKPHYDAWFNGGGEFGISKWDGSHSPPAKVLTTFKISKGYDGFFEFAVAAAGNQLTVYANGKRILEVRGADVSEHPGDVFVGGEGLFQDVEAQVLDPAPGGGSGFVPLFNGKDLTGWKTHPSQPGNWRVVKGAGGDGVLTGSGPPATSHLYTERGDYKDFHLRLEARINDGGNSGVYFRAPFGPSIPNGAKVPTWVRGYNAKLDQNRAGGLLIDDLPPVRARAVPPRPGEWVLLDVIAQGNHLTFKINGTTTAELTDEKRRYTGGHIVLQQHTEQTVIEFRKIEIKEFK
jgi:hypothetical protein